MKFRKIKNGKWEMRPTDIKNRLRMSSYIYYGF